MKDLIVITANCPTEEQEKSLEKCIDSVLKCGVHIALISHTHIPIHLQKKCNYYVYDYKNEISNDLNLIGFKWFKTDEWHIMSCFFNKYFYGFAIYRMFSIASQIAINFGYKNIHHIEYDCELIDKNIISEHCKLLEKYDSVMYTDTGTSDGFLFGSLKSFNVKSLPEKFKCYDKEFIYNEISKLESPHLEILTKNLFMDSGKVLFKHEDELSSDKFKKGFKFYSRNIHYTLYYDSSDDTLNVFYKSLQEFEEHITIIINHERIINLRAKPNNWHIRKLGLFNEIDNVRIDNSKKVIFEMSFDNESRRIYKIKSYIKLIDNDEKNN
jgi:hypothetical protein